MRKKLKDKPEEDFLARWSRKKGELEPSSDPIEMPDDNPLADDQQLKAQPEQAEQQAQNLTDEDMPPIESLDESSDYSGFLSPGVSDELRQLALRKLFRSAKFNVRDGLDDYDDDFSSFAALGDIVTSDMKHQLELAEERKREAEDHESAIMEEQADVPDKINEDQVAEQDDNESNMDDIDHKDEDIENNKNGDLV